MSVFGAVLDTGGFVARLGAGLGSGAVLWTASGAAGGRIFDRLLGCLPDRDRLAFGAAAGFALIGTCVALLGLFHAISFVSLMLLVAAALACAIPNVRAWPASIRDAAQGFRSAGGLDKTAWLVAAAAWVTGAIAAALPAVDWDPLAYHLPIAAAALVHGAFVFDPNLAQTAFPLLAEAAALPAFALAGSSGAAFAILGAGIAMSLVAAALADRVRAGSGPLTCALVASSSLWLWIAPAFYIDVPFALFALAALGLALMLDPLDARGAALIGLFAGAAAATKYPGLEIAIIALAIAAWRAARPSRGRAIPAFAATAVAFASGWYVRGFVVAGDPVYPFATGLLGGTADAQAFAARYVSMTSEWCGGHASLADFALLPWRLLTEPQFYCGDQGYALRLAAVLFTAAFFVPRARVFATVTIVLLALWFWTSRQWRFLTTALATYAIAAAAGLDALAERHRPMIAGALLVLAASSVVLNWLPQPGRDASNSLAPAFAYMRGGQSGQEYLARRLESYEADAWVLGRLSPGETVASIDDVRSYYLGPAAIDLNPYYQAQWRLDWSAPSAQRYRALSGAHVKYLIVNANRAYLARTPVDIDWTSLAADERSRQIQRVFSANDVVVYELVQNPSTP